jgi:hypothetical protein
MVAKPKMRAAFGAAHRYSFTVLWRRALAALPPILSRHLIASLAGLETRHRTGSNGHRERSRVWVTARIV